MVTTFIRHPGAAVRGLLLLAALAAAIPFTASAQDQQVTLRLIAFPRSADDNPIELRVEEGQTVEVTAPSNQISPPQTVPRAPVWSFGQTVTGADGENEFQEFGRAPALNSPSQLIVLVRKGDDNSDGFEVLALDDRDTGFGGGEFLFFNASSVDIAGETGGQQFGIRPGGHRIVRPQSEDGAASFHAAFYFRAEDRVRPFFSSQWPVSDRARGLIFFYHDPNTGRLRLHSIRDFP